MDSGVVPNDVTTDDNSAENNKLSKDTEAISNVEAANEANDDNNDDDDISFSHASNDDITQDDMDDVESARPSFSGLSVDVDESIVDR